MIVNDKVMSELLNEEEVEMEVLNEYGEVIYSGEFDEYFAMNNYDEELEDILNRVMRGTRGYIKPCDEWSFYKMDKRR